MNVRNITHSYMALSNSYNSARSLRYQAILVLFRRVSISEGQEGRYSVEFTSKRNVLASTVLIIILYFWGKVWQEKKRLWTFSIYKRVRSTLTRACAIVECTLYWILMYASSNRKTWSLYITLPLRIMMKWWNCFSKSSQALWLK